MAADPEIGTFSNDSYVGKQVPISWWRTSFGEEEIEKLRQAVLNEHISAGPVTEEFEKKLAQILHVPYVAVTTSGSAALLLALMALGIKRDDEVIVPNRTWIATAHAALMIGAKVVLVDVQADIPVMDVSQIRKKITSRTKAIIPVHLNGRSVDMSKINKIAKEYGLYVVEDAAQAFYSKNMKGFLGTQSDVGCFSLGVTKVISTGQGGFLVTRDKKIYEKIKFVRNHGVTDIFTDTWNQMGFNLKFTDLLASFGLVQLTRLPKRIEHLQAIYERYKKALYGLPFLKIVPTKLSVGEVPLYAEVLSDRRTELVDFLKSRNIQVRPVPPSLDISNYIDHDGHFPHSKIFAEQGVYLPCGPEQPLENVDAVINVLRQFNEKKV